MPVKPQKAGHMLRDVPIARLLSLSFGFLTAASITAVLMLTVLANVKNTFSFLNLRSMDAVSSLTSLIDAYLEPVELTVRSLSGQIRRDEISLDDHDALNAILRGAITANRMVVVFQVFDLDFNSRGVFRQGSVFGILPVENERHPAIRQGLQAIPVDGEPHWGELVLVQGVVHANVAQALIVNGQHVGYLIGAVPLPRLSGLVAQISRAAPGTAFILDGTDRVLAHPSLSRRGSGSGPNGPGNGGQNDGEPDPIAQGEEYAPELQRQIDENADNVRPILPMENRDTPTVALIDFDDPILATYSQREIAEDLFEQAADAGVEVSEGKIGEKSYIFMTTQMTGYAARPWTVGVYFSGDTVDEELERLVGSTAIGLIFLLISAAAAFWLGRRIGKPIAELNKMAGRVTTLDFDKVHDMPPSRIREFNESAVVINSMVAALRAFAAYVPRRLVSQLIESGTTGAVRSQERDVTVMFTDIVGFTAMSEHMSASETALFLNEHFAILCAEVDQSGGTVDKFMGDGMMAFWGAPDPLDDHPARAAKAAITMARSLEDYNAMRGRTGEPPVRLRIGIHSGPVIVGNIGPSDRINYTIVGDTVNSCQRLEALGKVVAPDADIVALVSSDTEARLPDDIARDKLSAFHVPGREAAIQVSRLDLSKSSGM